jgi:hypothetical protein
MLNKNPDYRELRKLRGSATSIVARSSYSYWLGKDHLLLVEVAAYSELYRRFFFRDMQALVVSGTRRRLWVNILHALLTCLFLTLALLIASEGDSDPAYLIPTGIFGGMALLPLAGLVRNTLAGPGAEVTLVTTVQATPLPGISRWRRAEILLAELKPLIEAAQARAAASASEPSAAAAVSPAPESTTTAAAPSQGI